LSGLVGEKQAHSYVATIEEMSRQYLNAAKVVRAVISGESLKKYCSKHKVGKEEYALVCETLKYNEVIDNLLKSSKCDSQELGVDEFVLKVMIYELFFGKKKIKGGGVVKRMIMSKFDLFEDTLREEMEKKGKTSHEQLQSDIILESSSLPKYVRINKIKMDPMTGLLDIKARYPLAQEDSDIPSLVKIPYPYGGISDMSSVKIGEMIIQDKASCFPSQILFDEWSENGSKGDFIDACAAPGNKTSHLSALSWDCQAQTFGTTIFAFDRNISRCELLKTRMGQAGAANVQVSCDNFLEIDPNLQKYCSVTSILVDPSCSGSGVVRSLERAVERSHLASSGINCDHNPDENERLLKLSQFQVTVITKALQFPSVDSVVYSTCSVHQVGATSICSQHFFDRSKMRMLWPKF
jgi:25S rRNA (cytosine2278-C5)-methyltransferase